MIIKGVCHVHSIHSYDGRVSLSKIKELFLKNGLQFVCMTEHTDWMTEDKVRSFIEECQKLSDDNFLIIPGFEFSYGKSHILMIGSDKFISQGDEKSTLLKWAEKTGFVVLAHPHKNNYKIDETVKSLIDAVEVWNSQYDGKYAPRFRSFGLLKKLQKEKRFEAFAGLDFHREEHLGGPILFVNVNTFSNFAILNAIKTGDYTFGKKEVIFSSKGEIQEGNLKKLYVQSFFSIKLISFSKQINKIFVSIGLSFPKKLKQKIRAKI